MGRKLPQASLGILSGENKSAGFTSLLILAGLSIAAGSMLYSSTTSTRNMNTMLQTDRVRYNRDAIANALRYSVSIPAILRLSADLDSGSDLKGCIDSSNATPCDAVNADGSPKTHELKVFDVRSSPLAGTTGSPVFYDALNGNFCTGPTASNCPIRATAWFTINCGTDVSCKGKPAATLKIGFKVEQGTGELPNKMALSPIEVVPNFPIPLTLSALQTNVMEASVAPGDPNDRYTPIDDTSNSGDISVFDPVTGSKVCNDMRARGTPPGNPPIVYETQPTVNSPAVQYTGITGDLHASDENISDISHVTGSVWANSKNIANVSDITAAGPGLSLNSVTIGPISNITSSHSYIVAGDIGPVSHFTGHWYASANKITQFSNITTNEYFTNVYRGWVTSGATALTAVSFSSITSGNFLLCGFDVNDLSNVTANFVGLQNASVRNTSSSVTVNQLTVFGGNVANLSNFTGNMTLYNATAGNMSGVTGNLAFYNSNVGQISVSAGHVEAHGGNITKITGGVAVHIDLYGGATLGSHPGIPNANVNTYP